MLCLLWHCSSITKSFKQCETYSSSGSCSTMTTAVEWSLAHASVASHVFTARQHLQCMKFKGMYIVMNMLTFWQCEAYLVALCKRQSAVSEMHLLVSKRKPLKVVIHKCDSLAVVAWQFEHVFRTRASWQQTQNQYMSHRVLLVYIVDHFHGPASTKLIQQSSTALRVYIHTYIHTYMYIYMCIYKCVYMYVYICLYVCVSGHMDQCTWMSAHG